MRALILSCVVLIVSCAAAPGADDEEDRAAQTNELRASVYKTGGQSLNVRAKPSLSANVIGSVPTSTSVEIDCQTTGDTVDGTNIWDYLSAYGGYVSDAHLWTGYDGFAPSLRRCGSGSTPSAPSGGGGGGTVTSKGYLLPLECGTTARVTQGRGGYSHWNEAYYGTDFGLALDTPLVAMDDGTVSLVKNDIRPGNACYSGGGQSCANTLNYVVLKHSDGTDTAYLHINRALVSVGQVVRRGERIAMSGGTGWSTGPHAHVQRQQRCGSWWCQSVAVSFGDVPGGDTYTDQTVTSKNCK